MKPYTLPDATALTRAQHSGWACVFCRASLTKGAVKAGRAQGFIGAHDMSIDVYACPNCAVSLGLIERPSGEPECRSAPAATSRSKAPRGRGRTPRPRPEATP